MRELSASRFRQLALRPRATEVVALLPGRRWIVTAGQGFSMVSCHNYQTGQPGPSCNIEDCGVRELHSAADGETVFLVGEGGTLWSWRPGYSAEPSQWPCRYVYASLLTPEPGGFRAVCAHGLVDGDRGRHYGRNLRPEQRDGLTVWDVRTGALLADLQQVAWLAQSLAWIAGQEDRVRFRLGLSAMTIDITTGVVTDSQSFPLDWSSASPSPRFLPDGKAVLTAVNGQLVVWDLDRQLPSAVVADTDHVRLLAISPSGQRVLLVLGNTLEVRRLDRSHTVEAQLSVGAEERVSAACFGPREDSVAVVTTWHRVLWAELAAT
jgi:WD40 repeat protein